MGHWISLTRPGIDPLGSSEAIGTRFLVRWLIDNDIRFNSSGVGIRAAIAIEKALDEAKDQDWLFVEQDNFYSLLKDAAEQPQGQRGPHGYPVSPGRKMLPFIDDIVNALDKKPAKKKELAAV